MEDIIHRLLHIIVEEFYNFGAYIIFQSLPITRLLLLLLFDNAHVHQKRVYSTLLSAGHLFDDGVMDYDENARSPQGIRRDVYLI